MSPNGTTKEGLERQATEDFQNNRRQDTSRWDDAARQNYENQYNHETNRNK